MKQLILGLDPGTRRAGFGLVGVDGNRLTHVEHGVIRLKETDPLAARLAVLEKALRDIFRRHPITVTVVEQVFLGKNADSAFKLGHARGVCLMAAARHGVTVEEYAARYVKKCVTGSGAASKESVQLVVFQLLGLRGAAQTAFDASDALSLAITHARMGEVQAKLRAVEGEI